MAHYFTCDSGLDQIAWITLDSLQSTEKDPTDNNPTENDPKDDTTDNNPTEKDPNDDPTYSNPTNNNTTDNEPMKSDPTDNDLRNNVSKDKDLKDEVEKNKDSTNIDTTDIYSTGNNPTEINTTVNNTTKSNKVDGNTVGSNTVDKDSTENKPNDKDPTNKDLTQDLNNLCRITLNEFVCSDKLLSSTEDSDMFDEFSGNVGTFYPIHRTQMGLVANLILFNFGETSEELLTGKEKVLEEFEKAKQLLNLGDKIYLKGFSTCIKNK